MFPRTRHGVAPVYKFSSETCQPLYHLHTTFYYTSLPSLYPLSPFSSNEDARRIFGLISACGFWAGYRGSCMHGTSFRGVKAPCRRIWMRDSGRMTSREDGAMWRSATEPQMRSIYSACA